MESTHSEAQITQSGQAIKINNNTTSALKSLFSVALGPHGTYKAIITPGQSLTITKHGNVLCKDIQFVHPTSIVITKAAISLYNTYGDGSSSFIVLACDTFNNAYKYICDGVSVTNVCNSLQVAISDISSYLNKLVLPMNDDLLEQLSFNLLNTKVSKTVSKTLSPMLVKAIKNISSSQFQDVNMVEVMKMNEGDVCDTRYIDGLVLDHGGRHYGMPIKLENVCILVINMSLEYEKPEINAQFVYSSSQQREELVKNEREFILAKVRHIVNFAERLKQETGKNLMIVSEKGIDPFSLDVLSKAGILALRRAKRRNLERLIYMCGGNIVTQVNQLDPRNLGFCQSVRVSTVGEEKYTFIEGTPFKGSCTILVKGNNDNEMERMVNAIRGTLKSLHNTFKDKRCIKGGVSLYKNLIDYIKDKISTVREQDVVGYSILSETYTFMIKTFLKNSGEDIQGKLVKILRHGVDEEVIDSFIVSSGVLTNSAVVAMSLLMVDEIIKAGKCVKEDKIGN